MVGKAMASNEDDAYTIMQELGVDYVLVIFGGLLGNFDESDQDRQKTNWTVPGRPDHNTSVYYFRLFWWWYKQVPLDGSYRWRWTSERS